MIKVTDNKEVKETVLAGLKHNKDKYGKRYCPCSLIRDEDTVCMCKEFREMEEGTCHCQLYPRHYNAIMLEFTDFDDNKISYLARISRGHHVDTLLVPREYKDTFISTELYEILLPNISIGDVQFAKIYYYD